VVVAEKKLIKKFKKQVDRQRDKARLRSVVRKNDDSKRSKKTSKKALTVLVVENRFRSVTFKNICGAEGGSRFGARVFCPLNGKIFEM
jgi:hypothetical protein